MNICEHSATTFAEYGTEFCLLLYISVFDSVYFVMCQFFLLSNFIVNLWVTPHVHASLAGGMFGVSVGGLYTEGVLPARTATSTDHRYSSLPLVARVPIGAPICVSNCLGT